MTKKRCFRCRLHLPLSMFAINRSKKDGLNSHCRRCQAKYHRKHYLVNKSTYVDGAATRRLKIREYLASKKLACATVGCLETHPAALDFHHTDPTEKDVNVATIVTRGWSIARIDRELKKCVVLCANCHRKLHWTERFAGVA